MSHIISSSATTTILGSPLGDFIFLVLCVIVIIFIYITYNIYKKFKR